MAKFIGNLNVHWLPDGKLKLDEPLIYFSEDEKYYRVPAGFITDLASVPKLIPGIVRLFFRGPLQTAWAAVLHDYLYKTGQVSKRKADALFFEALKATGEGTVGAWLMWGGVAVGAWIPWWRHRRRQN